MHTQDIEQVASPPRASSGPFWKIVAVAALVIAAGYLLVYSGVFYRTYMISAFGNNYNTALAKGCELRADYGDVQRLYFVRCPFWVVP